MGIEMWVALASALVALGGAAAAVVQARHAKVSAEAAQKSAEVARDALDLERSRFEAEYPRVAWRVERLAASDGYRLVNIGSGSATGVVASFESPHVSGLPSGVTIKSGDGWPFSLVRMDFVSAPESLSVTWDDHPEPVAVLIPR